MERRDDGRRTALAARPLRDSRRDRPRARLRGSASAAECSGCRHPDDRDRRGGARTWPWTRVAPVAADEAAQRGAREVFLEVRADNPTAQALYASEGFVEVGRRPRYYQPDDVDAVVMKLDLASWTSARALPRMDGAATDAGACT